MFSFRKISLTVVMIKVLRFLSKVKKKKINKGKAIFYDYYFFQNVGKWRFDITKQFIHIYCPRCTWFKIRQLNLHIYVFQNVSEDWKRKMHSVFKSKTKYFYCPIFDTYIHILVQYRKMLLFSFFFFLSWFIFYDINNYIMKTPFFFTIFGVIFIKPQSIFSWNKNLLLILLDILFFTNSYANIWFDDFSIPCGFYFLK